MQHMFICPWYLKKLAVIKTIDPGQSAGLSSTSRVCKSANLLDRQFPFLWSVGMELNGLPNAWTVEVFFSYLESVSSTDATGSWIPLEQGWHQSEHLWCFPLHPTLPGALHCLRLIAGLTAPVVARRWHFSIFRNRRTNHRTWNHSGFCFSDKISYLGVKTTKEHIFLTNI